MPFSATFEFYPMVERVQRVSQKPIAGRQQTINHRAIFIQSALQHAGFFVAAVKQWKEYSLQHAGAERLHEHRCADKPRLDVRDAVARAEDEWNVTLAQRICDRPHLFAAQVAVEKGPLRKRRPLQNAKRRKDAARAGCDIAPDRFEHLLQLDRKDGIVFDDHDAPTRLH